MKSPSFRVRLVLVMTGLLLLAQLATGIAMLRTTSSAILDRGSEQLRVGADVLERMLTLRSDQLRDNVELLAADFGFKSAVATSDHGTLESVLANHGRRVHADLVMLANLDGRLMASSHHDVSDSPPFPFEPLWQRAQANNGAIGIVIFAGAPYQFVLSPVHAPNLIAWVGMGFLIDASLAQSLSELTHQEVSFITYGSDADERGRIDTTMGDDYRQSLQSIGESIKGTIPANSPTFSPDNATLILTRELTRQNTGEVFAVLQMPRDTLMAPFHELKYQLIAIFALVLAIGLAVTLISARAISRPIQRLADMAQRIGQGQRATDIRSSVSGEFALLANTLAIMQSDLERRENELLHQSRHNALTGLPNRTSAEHDIASLVAQRTAFTLLRLCINDFKQINDSLGYAMGDEVLIAVARRLETHTDARTYRFGGDEFVLVAIGEHTPNRLMEEVKRRISEPIMVANTQLLLKVSIGEAAYPEHGDSASHLLRRSDIALNLARETPSMTLRYPPGSDERHQRRLRIIRDLPHALMSGQLHLAYQPQIDLKSGQIRQYEALARWHHPELGSIAPDEFIALAEQSGSIQSLTTWLLNTAAHQLADWRNQGVSVCMALNLSVEDLGNRDLPSQLHELVARHGLNTGQLRLEITESAVMRDPPQAIVLLQQLRDIGHELAIDDYGTGYSSLAQLKRMPVHELKIDKSFVMHLDRQPDDDVILRSTVELGHRLGLCVVAEGVENGATLRRLRSFGCDYAQGYWIAKPMAADAVLDWQRDYPLRQERERLHYDSSP